MQMRIFHETFRPVPYGGRHYVPALQNRSGELQALRRATPDTWERLTPLLQVVGPKGTRSAFPQSTVKEWVKRLAAAVGPHPCFLDIRRLKATVPVTTSGGHQPVLRVLYMAARKRGIQFVPVLPVHGVSLAHRGLVKEAVIADGRGVALRYPVRSAVPVNGYGADLFAALTAVAVDIPSADLLVDLEWLEPDILEPRMILDVLNEVANIGDWRSIVLLGTSIPAQLGVVPEGMLMPLARLEWALWSQIRALHPSRLPAFGDYAIQHPRPPHEGGGPGMRANVRYTSEVATLIARSAGPLFMEGNAQYRSLCQRLVNRPEFRGRDYSWGDEVIYDCASGVIEPGAQDLWRGAGTSHHLRLITEQLSSY